jgi:hypothetical protein
MKNGGNDWQKRSARWVLLSLALMVFGTLIIFIDKVLYGIMQYTL